MRFGFDQFVLDVDQRELSRDGEIVAIEPQVFDLVRHLIAQRHRVVSKDELIQSVWNGRIVSESTITSRVNAARKALGDSGREQKLLRTYARRGVRFVGEVRDAPPPIGDSLLERDNPLPADRSVSAGGKPIVTVLPFRNLSPDGTQPGLAEGVTEDVATALAWHRSLTVCSPHLRSARDARGPAAEPNARYVLEGSVRTFGQRVRISAQLLESTIGAHLWAERYDLASDSLAAALDEVTAKIAARIETEVGTCERLRSERKPEQALSASDYLQLGLKHFYRASPADNATAQQLFRRAIEIDPALAQAHALLSYAIVLAMVYHGAEVDDARLDEAIECARAATALDERDAMNRFALGRALLARKDYPRALAEMHAALDLNPTLAVVHCGLGDSLAYESRFAEAIPHFEKAIELSPKDPQRWAYMAYRSLAHLFAGELADAAAWAERASQVPGAHYWPYAHRVAALGNIGESEEMKTAVAELEQLKPDFSCAFAREHLFFIKDRSHLDIYLHGLRKAGVRE